MASTAEQHIFFLDDELEVREAVGETLEDLGVRVSYFARPADCLEQLGSQRCDLLITDLKMPQMNGIELLAEAKRLAPWVPVLLVTGYGDIPTAVTAVKAGAVDFIEKPLDRETFLRKVKSALQRSISTGPDVGKALTASEIRILKLVIKGMSNREIAGFLHRSVRTVEAHRAHIMHKLSVDNLVDLVRRATAMGLIELPAEQGPGEAGENAEKHP